MKRILLILAVLLLLPSLVSATEYYVTQNGGGNGLSQGSPMSVGEHNSRSFSPGDFIYFSGMINSRIIPPSSGSPSGGYITYDGLIDGDYDAINHVGGSPAVFQGTSEIIDNYDAIRITARDYIRVQDLEFTNWRIGIIINGLAPEGSDHITVRRCYFHDLGSRGVSSLTDHATYSTRNTNIVIGGAPDDGNEFFNIGAGTASYDIKMAAVDGGIVSYNHLWANGGKDGVWGTIDDRGISGISWGHNPTNLLIEYNTVHSHKDKYYGCPDPDRICDYNAENSCYNLCGLGEGEVGGKGGRGVVVRYNHIYDNDIEDQGAGVSLHGDFDEYYVYGNSIHDVELSIYVSDASTSPSIPEGQCGNGVRPGTGYIFSNEIWHDSGQFAAILVGDPYCFSDHSTPDVIEYVGIFNNVIADNGGDAIYLRGNYYETVDIKNNILYKNNPGSYRQIDVERTSGVTIDNNRYYWPDHTSTTLWGGTYYDSLDVPGQETHGSEGDPGFIDAYNNNYRLLDTSYCKDTGLELGSDYDEIIHPSTNWEAIPPDVVMMQQGSDWVIGAYGLEGDLPSCLPPDECCSSGQSCQDGVFRSSPDCGVLCCVGGTCQDPPQTQTCQSRELKCCLACVPDTAHPENDTDCPVVCCEECMTEPASCDGLVMLMHFDNDPDYGETATHVHDFSGEGNHGTVSGATHTPAGKFGGAFDFDGMGDMIDCGSGSSIDDIFSSGGTVSAWINMSGYGSDDASYILSKYRDIGYWIFWVNDKWQSRAIQFTRDFDGGSGSWSRGDSMSTGEWMHVAFTYDESSADNDPVIYLNGNPLVINYEDAPAGAAESDALNTLIIGARDTDNLRNFEGIIDEVSVWDRVLSGQEIQDLSGSSAPLSCGQACIHQADKPPCDGKVDIQELTAFIDHWKYDSTTYPMWEMMAAVVLYYNP